MTPILARPQWRIGQVLLPEHFQGLEVALTADAALRSRFAGLPANGLLRLEWWGPTPDKGILWVSNLTAILSDGLLVDVPGNAVMVGPLDLNLPGRPIAVVYAHVFTEDTPPRLDYNEPDPRDIPRQYHQIKLSTDASLPGSRERLCLGEFVLADDGAFHLSRKIVPSLLSLHDTPYFQDDLAQVRREIAEFEKTLDDAGLARFSRSESLMAVQRARIEARKVVALLDDMAGGVYHHPYTAYSALRSFAVELCVLDDTAVPWQPRPYEHADPRTCFNAVFLEITNKLRAPPPESPCVSFELENGRWTASLPADALEAQELYIAVRKQRAGEWDPLEGVRLASPERLRHVREHVLRGVRTVRLDRAPFRHAFGPGVDFYRVVSPEIGEESPEWAHVKHERALAFYHDARFDGYKILLCWGPRC